jgi:hypothetical protein
MILIFLFSFSAYATSYEPDTRSQQAVEKLFDQVLSESGKAKSFLPTAWNKEIKSKEIDINEATGENYPGGIAYGAVCWRTLNHTFPEIAAFFAKGGVPEKIVRKVKTLVNFDDVQTSPDRMRTFMQTEIDVPVVSNFKTAVMVEQAKLSDTKYAVQWKQKSDKGSLVYNQGVAIIEALGDRSKMTVVGVHIIKEENKVPWIGRATASSFAKSHYCNFIRATDKIDLSN